MAVPSIAPASLALFQRIPDRLFGPLASQNRHGYWALLCHLHRSRFGPDAPLPPSYGFLQRDITQTVRDDRVLLYDLGGVLAESTGRAALKPFLPQLQVDALILDRWLDTEAIVHFERDHIQPNAFARMFTKEGVIQLDPSDFLTVFSSWVRGNYPGAKSLLQNLRK
jgi:hypothetical protein